MNHNWLTPELILLNGNFHTQDAKQPRVRAVCIGGGRILAMGNDEDIKPLADSNTEVIDLGGQLGLPGMIDSHFHFYDWVLSRQQLELADVKSFKELIDQVAFAANEAAPGTWVVGQGWNESDWPENRMPTRDDLDAVAPSHPVALWRCDMHLASVNSMALKVAGIDENTPNPPRGLSLKTLQADQTVFLGNLPPI